MRLFFLAPELDKSLREMQIRQRFQNMHLEFNGRLFQPNTKPSSNSNENENYETGTEDDSFIQEADE